MAAAIAAAMVSETLLIFTSATNRVALCEMCVGTVFHESTLDSWGFSVTAAS